MEQQKPSTALFDVFLRLRPSSAVDRTRFLDVEHPEDNASTHILIRPPTNDYRKRAIERFGFTRVFEEHAGQRELFESTGAVQMVEGVLGAQGREGRDGLVATLGVTGSGKSHTILGSKSQRGITQLTLDVLFNHATPHLVDIDRSMTAFQSLCAADVAESQLLPGATFLDSIYCEHYGPSRGTTPARGATPALVRDSSLHIPGAFISQEDLVVSHKKSSAVFDRLYPSLAKYQNRLSRIPLSPTKFTSSPYTKSKVSRLMSSEQETSLLSAPTGSRRHAPRVSALPTYPPTEDVSINVDSTAEYAIVVSMYEVHNDRIFDLLASTSSRAPQAIRRRPLLFKSTEKSQDRKVVAGLKKVVCSDLEEALLVLETGLQERRVADTSSNATSSRSHGFFCVEVKKRHRGSIPGPWTSSTLTIVDLAGSERARVAKTQGATLAEAGKINESLMYLGQCMQLQSDNATAVPYRQCKLTELLFSNSLAAQQQQHGPYKAPQKAIMIVTADPLGDFNATIQILRYSALAKEVTVPRIPSLTEAIGIRPGTAGSSRPTTPSAIAEELEQALSEIARLREELEISQLRLEEETQRRQEVEVSWKAAESRIEDVEVEVREEVWAEMEAKMAQEQRRWRAARDAELDAQDSHLDRKLEIMARGITIHEDEEDDDKENVERRDGSKGGDSIIFCRNEDEEARLEELDAENAQLRERLALMEREKEVQRSPSKKMKVLKTRRWQGSGMVLDEESL